MTRIAPTNCALSAHPLSRSSPGGFMWPVLYCSQVTCFRHFVPQGICLNQAPKGSMPCTPVRTLGGNMACLCLAENRNVICVGCLAALPPCCFLLCVYGSIFTACCADTVLFIVMLWSVHPVVGSPEAPNVSVGGNGHRGALMPADCCRNIFVLFV